MTRQRAAAFAIVFALCAQTLGAQGVGMGARRGTGARLEAPYTLAVETPHVPWARPLAGGPIRLLAVPTVSEGRTLVELAQRLSLDLTTVSIDPRFDANKWTMGFGRDYGARAEKGDLSLVYSYLEAELVSDKKFDVILLQLSHGWERMSPAAREALARRVREGAGLVLIRPFASEISPLAPVAAVTLPADASEPVEPAAAEPAPWRRAADHYITRAIPLESFPFDYVRHYALRAVPGASVLVQSESGPVVAEHRYGKGRVIAFGYKNAGLSWHMPMSARGFVPDLQWEYFYSLLCRALIYAAGREPSARSDFDAPGVEWRLVHSSGGQKAAGKGKAPAFSNLPAGRYFLERRAASDWNISAVDIGKPARVDGLRATPEVIAEGGQVEVTWNSDAAAKAATVELIDGLGRVIARAQGAGRATLKAARPLVHSGFVRVTLASATAQAPVLFAASSREWSDYEVLMPWYGPPSYQPWIPALDEQFRKIGLTALAHPERNFRLMSSAALHDEFGVYSYRSARYRERKQAYAETKDKKYLTRDVVLQDPGFENRLREKLAPLARRARLKPLAYYIADESSLTSYTDPFDVDWAPAAIAEFREWLRGEYASLEVLNKAWGTAFGSWDAVVPMTTEEAQKHGNYAPWSDHRVYMERSFVQALAKAREIVREIDPRAVVSISGTQVPTAHTGTNWYRINQHMDYLQPYSGGNQDAMHHLFRPGIRLTGFTGYQTIGTALRQQQWRRLFYGHTGASIFWHYTLLNPDLAMSEQGQVLAETFGQIQGGIGRVFLNSRVHEDGVAIHFSMASIRGAWIQDGKIRPNVGNVIGTSPNYEDLVGRRAAWVTNLEKQGLQFRFLATEQIEEGALDQFRVLILPYSIALSDKEARAIERFMDRGGIVYADEQAGRMDERCRWRKTPLWPERKGLVRLEKGQELPVLPVKPSFEVEGDFLRTVRDFGKSRLIGLLAAEARNVTLPPAKSVRYDLLRGRLAPAEMHATPGEPVLLVERARRIARLEITPELELKLTEEAGTPVDRSVVRVEVVDPAGKVVRHYSGNVTIVDGRATFSLPFALNDAAGDWRLRARDVVSGLTAERVVRTRNRE